ncbi:hypothetical protein Q3G72_012147 [Acer saccharum]|nr:hypothetical protein Q3G72_012147 [Acer saccharum]
MQVKTYNSKHECHRVYRSEEARSKWIASKFETIVKNNPNIKCGVIADMLREQFNVIVDAQRLYKAKKRALIVLGREHSECFSHLRRYAFMVQQCDPVKERLIDFVHPNLSKSAFVATYHSMIHPIPNICSWADVEVAHVDPPSLLRKPGRPKLLRKRESSEKPKSAKRGSVICAKCTQTGHNKRTCKTIDTSGSNKVAKGGVSSSQPVQGTTSSSQTAHGTVSSAQPAYGTTSSSQPAHGGASFSKPPTQV